MRSTITLLGFLAALPAGAAEFPLPPADSDVIGETITSAAGSRRHAARPRTPPRPRLRGDHQREPGHRPVAARRGHTRGRSEAAPAAARAAHRNRDQPAGAPALLVSARDARPAAGGVYLPGQHRQDGLEHAARHDDDRLQGKGRALDTAEIGARGTCEARRPASGSRVRAARTTRWAATRWRSEFRAAPT